MEVFDKVITLEMVDILKDKQAYNNLRDMMNESSVE